MEIRIAAEGERVSPRKCEAIAPAWHTVVMILLVLAPLIQGIFADKRDPASATRPLSAVPFYLTGTVVLWIWFAFLWWGLRLRGHSLRELVGGRWLSARQAANDILLSMIFWGFWYLVLSAFKAALARTGMVNAGVSGMVFPNTGFEVGLWIVSAISAGVVEESVFRGYLMKQFTALSGRTEVGLVLQGLLFGVAHAGYLGIRQATLITVSGMLIGGFTMWRRNLRSAMIFHTWADIFGAVIVRGLPFQ